MTYTYARHYGTYSGLGSILKHGQIIKIQLSRCSLLHFLLQVTRLVGWLEFSVPFQHKYGHIRDVTGYTGSPKPASFGLAKFLKGRRPYCHPTNSVSTQKGTQNTDHGKSLIDLILSDPVPHLMMITAHKISVEWYKAKCLSLIYLGEVNIWVTL